MQSTVRVYGRTGIVGAWAVFIGVAVIIATSRFLEMFQPESREVSGLALAGPPLATLVFEAVLSLYNSGSTSVLLGMFLVFAGWYQLVRLV